jgi:hypothetical protein
MSWPLLARKISYLVKLIDNEDFSKKNTMVLSKQILLVMIILNILRNKDENGCTSNFNDNGKFIPLPLMLPHPHDYDDVINFDNYNKIRKESGAVNEASDDLIYDIRPYFKIVKNNYGANLEDCEDILKGCEKATIQNFTFNGKSVVLLGKRRELKDILIERDLIIEDEFSLKNEIELFTWYEHCYKTIKIKELKKRRERHEKRRQRFWKRLKRADTWDVGLFAPVDYRENEKQLVKKERIDLNADDQLIEVDKKWFDKTHERLNIHFNFTKARMYRIDSRIKRNIEREVKLIGAPYYIEQNQDETPMEDELYRHEHRLYDYINPKNVPSDEKIVMIRDRNEEIKALREERDDLTSNRYAIEQEVKLYVWFRDYLRLAKEDEIIMRKLSVDKRADAYRERLKRHRTKFLKYIPITGIIFTHPEYTVNEEEWLDEERLEIIQENESIKLERTLFDDFIHFIGVRAMFKDDRLIRTNQALRYNREREQRLHLMPEGILKKNKE